jgi:hypothetical protein
MLTTVKANALKKLGKFFEQISEAVLNVSSVSHE